MLVKTEEINKCYELVLVPSGKTAIELRFISRCCAKVWNFGLEVLCEQLKQGHFPLMTAQELYSNYFFLWELKRGGNILDLVSREVFRFLLKDLVKSCESAYLGRDPFRLPRPIDKDVLFLPFFYGSSVFVNRDQGYLMFPKVGKIKYLCREAIEGRIVKVAVSRTVVRGREIWGVLLFCMKSVTAGPQAIKIVRRASEKEQGLFKKRYNIRDSHWVSAWHDELEVMREDENV